MIAIEPLPARIRCTACSAETSSSLLEIAPATMGWLLLEGFWFCADHAAAAPWIVLLDRARNAHQAALLRQEQLRDDDLIEAATTYEAMRAEIEVLRCGDLGEYFDGELSTERRDAFDRHLATCERCAAGLLGLMQQDAVVSQGFERRAAVVDAAVACVRRGGTLAALTAAVNAMEDGNG